jgi:hypothetical protein
MSSVLTGLMTQRRCRESTQACDAELKRDPEYNLLLDLFLVRNIYILLVYISNISYGCTRLLWRICFGNFPSGDVTPQSRTTSAIVNGLDLEREQTTRSLFKNFLSTGNTMIKSV